MKDRQVQDTVKDVRIGRLQREETGRDGVIIVVVLLSLLVLLVLAGTEHAATRKGVHLFFVVPDRFLLLLQQLETRNEVVGSSRAHETVVAVVVGRNERVGHVVVSVVSVVVHQERVGRR